MSWVKITDYEDRMLLDLLSQHKERPRIVSLVKAFAKGIQDAEDDLDALMSAMRLPTATGAILDIWGEIVGEPRDGASDAIYRRFIFAKVLVNNSFGTTDNLIEIVAALEGVDPEDVDHTNYFPASAELSVTVPTVSDAATQRKIRRALDIAGPAGVNLQIVEATTGYFGWFADPDALGFDDGTFASII